MLLKNMTHDFVVSSKGRLGTIFPFQNISSLNLSKFNLSTLFNAMLHLICCKLKLLWLPRAPQAQIYLGEGQEC